MSFRLHQAGLIGKLIESVSVGARAGYLPLRFRITF